MLYFTPFQNVLVLKIDEETDRRTERKTEEARGCKRIKSNFITARLEK